jgi:hypothetical protein
LRSLEYLCLGFCTKIVVELLIKICGCYCLFNFTPTLFLCYFIFTSTMVIVRWISVQFCNNCAVSEESTILTGHVLKGETSKRNETTETKRPKPPKRPKRNDRNETAETKRPKRNGRKYKLQEKWKILIKT